MTIEDILAAMQTIMDGSEGRPLTDEEVTQYEGLEAQLAVANRDREVRARHNAWTSPVRDALPIGGAPQPAARNPLAYTPHALDAVHAAIKGRTAGAFAGRMTAEQLQELRNATLTTTTYGQPAEWGANVLGGPRLLHVAGGVPRSPSRPSSRSSRSSPCRPLRRRWVRACPWPSTTTARAGRSPSDGSDGSRTCPVSP